MGPLGNDLGSIALTVAVLRQSSEAGGGQNRLPTNFVARRDVFTELTDLQCTVGLDPIEGRTTPLAKFQFNLSRRVE